MILKSNIFNTMYLCSFGLLEQYLFYRNKLQGASEGFLYILNILNLQLVSKHIVRKFLNLLHLIQFFFWIFFKVRYMFMVQERKKQNPKNKIWLPTKNVIAPF